MTRLLPSEATIDRMMSLALAWSMFAINAWLTVLLVLVVATIVTGGPNTAWTCRCGCSHTHKDTP